jgi:hypothetical protein
MDINLENLEEVLGMTSSFIKSQREENASLRAELAELKKVNRKQWEVLNLVNGYLDDEDSRNVVYSVRAALAREGTCTQCGGIPEGPVSLTGRCRDCVDDPENDPAFDEPRPCTKMGA